MKRREVLVAAVALPISVGVPAIVALPKTTYRYFQTTKLPPLKWVPIKPFMADGTHFPPPGGRLKWMSGKETFGA